MSIVLDVNNLLALTVKILSSHYDSAIGHIRSGIKIMNEVDYDPRSGTFCHASLRPSTVTRLEMDTLQKMLVRLQDQAFILVSLLHSLRVSR